MGRIISEILIKNFKSLKSIHIPLSMININYGLNGMGKSSMTQSLLLIKQSIDEQLLPDEGITLNGSCISLGVGKDVFCEFGDDTLGIEFELVYDDSRSTLNIEYSPSIQDFDYLPINTSRCKNLKNLEDLEINYLTSERIAPHAYFDRSSYHVERKNSLGFKGEYLAHFLDFNDTLAISDNRKHKLSVTSRLDENIEKWLKEISPDIRFQVNSDSDNNIAQIRFFYTNRYKKTRYHKPGNVGYGITNVLPLITMLLSAKPNTILILENPELHLHPRGQESLARLISICACENIQIFVETHSGELIKGISKYANQFGASYSLNFFHRKENSFETEVTSHSNISSDIPDIYDFLSDENIANQQLVEKIAKFKNPIILTEGKTDTDILNFILEKLKGNGEFADLDITISNLETLNGGDKLLQIAPNLGEVCNSKLICLFDRDFKLKAKIDGKEGVNWKSNGKNTYNMILPCPSFRVAGNNVSIELLFTNETLKQVDEDGRRLFVSSEFNKYGDHEDNSKIRLIDHPKKIEKICTPELEKILDSGYEIINEDLEKVVLSKNDFAELLVNRLISISEEDLNSFRSLFKSVEDIIEL